MFLSQPQLYQCDSNLVLAPLLATYCHHLNSEDFFNPDLALEKHKAKGGTLCLWHKALDPFASLLPTTSPAVLPLLLSVPGLSPSAHIGIYLPTRGQDQEFVLALAALSAVLQELKENHRDVPIYIRGDANTNPNNQSRFSLFQNFLSQFSLSSLDLGHPTYHHLMGEGASDSQLDVLLYSAPLQLEESLDRIMCSQENPLISSHHDLILSAFKSSKVPFITPPQALSTPKVQNTRIKVCWKSGEGLKQYKSLLASSLPLLHESLSSPPSQALVSVLLKCTNFALNRAAEVSFKTVKISINSDNKEVVIDRNVKKAQKEALQASKNLRTLALPPPPRLLQSK